MNVNTFTALMIAIPGLLIGGPIAATVYDAQEVTTTYRVAAMFGGGMGVIQTTKGRLGMYKADETLGYYGGGEPRVVGFGCDEAKPGEIMIAMEEDELSHCERIEGITYDHKASWAN